MQGIILIIMFVGAVYLLIKVTKDLWKQNI